jgi:hypothetical protein
MRSVLAFGFVIVPDQVASAYGLAVSASSALNESDSDRGTDPEFIPSRLHRLQAFNQCVMGLASRKRAGLDFGCDVVKANG